MIQRFALFTGGRKRRTESVDDEHGLCGCIGRIIIRGRRSELECDLHRLPGCDGDGELLGPREPQAATEIVDLPLRPPTDAEVHAGGKVQRARGAEPRLLLLLHRGRRQPQRAATAQLRRAGGSEGGKRGQGPRARGRRWCGEPDPWLGRWGTAGRRQPRRASTARSRRAGGGEGGKRQAGRGSVRGRWWGGEAHLRLGRRGTTVDLTALGRLHRRIDLGAGSANCQPAAAFTTSVWRP